MDFFKIFDAYSLRARLFPAIIAAAPALAALALLISWKSFELSNAIATFALIVLLFAISDFARARGRAIEPKLYDQQGGKPSIILFRRTDSTIEEALKERYRLFLAGKLGVARPSPAAEQVDQAVADSFYEQCGVWLRANTRDTKKFPLLFGENVTYGYRRNLLGVKGLALGLNLTVVAICVTLLWHSNWPWGSESGKRTIVVLLIAVLHAIYVCTAVRKGLVRDASRAYARELILSCEAFIGSPGAIKSRPSTRKRKTRVP
jgi:hypothetical protein